MKLLKNLTRASFVPKKLEVEEKAPPRDSSTDLSSPKSTENSRKSVKDKAPVPESPAVDLVDGFLSPTTTGKKKKKKKKRTSSMPVMSDTVVDDSIRSSTIRSEMTTSDRTSLRGTPKGTPKNKKGGGKKKKKKKGVKGGSSRRSEASTIRQSLLLTPPEQNSSANEEIMEQTSMHSEREEVEGEAWLGNFSPHQPISSTLGPEPMPNLLEEKENEEEEEKSMRSFQLGIPPNEDFDPMNECQLSMADSFVMEDQLPIRELVVGGGGEIDDDVSDIGEPTVAEDMEGTAHASRTSFFMAPDDDDVCFQDRGQPGTRVMTKVIRNLLDENEDVKYTISMGKLIRRKMRGRRFLVMERQNSEVYWREAEKKEMHKLMADFFTEERRRKEEGLIDDDSDEESSLQDSARQSVKSDENSLDLDTLKSDDDDPPPPPPLPDMDKPSTPKTINSNSRKKAIPESPVAEQMKQKLPSGLSSGGETTSELLSQISEQRKNAEDYALPFNSYEMMENGRKAQEKLQAMVKKCSDLKAKTSESDELRLEIHKMDLIVERVMYASIGPLLEMLERMEETMNELTDEINNDDDDDDDERDIEISPPAPNQNPRLTNNNGPRLSVAMRKNRTVSVDNNDSQSSLNSGSKTNRTIRSGSKRSRESRNQSTHNNNNNNLNDSARSYGSGSRRNMDQEGHPRGRSYFNQSTHSHGSARSYGSGSRRNMDQEGHPRGRSYFNESRLEASGVSLFDDEISQVSEGEIAKLQASERTEEIVFDYANSEYDDEDMEDDEEPTEVEIPLNDEGDYDESLAESSGYSGSREKSVEDGNSNGTGASLGIDEIEEELENARYTVPLKGSSRDLSETGSYSEPSKSYSGSSPNSFRNSFASIDENKSHGSQSLRIQQVFQAEQGGDESRRSVTKRGKVLELSQSDDMSSIGESQRRLYGEDSDEDEDFQEMDISDVEDDDTEPVMSMDSDDDSQSIEKEPKEVVSQQNVVGTTKLEQFFDRLQHFFEVRRKVEERADIIDPAGKCRRMKMKCSTKLLPKANGEFGRVYQQQNSDNEVVKSLDELYAVAERARPALLKVLDCLTDDVMGLDMQSIELADLKPRDRAFEKAKEEFGDRRPGPPESWLYDVVRASVMCKSYKQMNDVNKWMQKNCDIVKAKNRFLEPAFNGYRDLLFHIVVTYDGTMVHICEIQVHHRDMNALDTQFGMPKHHEFFRSLFAGPWRNQEDTLVDLAVLNKHGDVGAMMVRLLRSKDPDQLRLFARLCREKLDEFDKALELNRRILVLQSKDGSKGNQDHETMADTHMNIGLVYGRKGEIDESLYHLQKALEIQEEGAGTDNAQGAELMTEIGRMLSKKGDFEGALANFEQALEIRENAFGNEHFMVISSLQDIGQAFGDMGDYAASEVSYRKALKLQEKMLNDVHPDIATTSRLIGTTLCKYGDFGTAMELHRLALSIRETSLGKNHPMTAESQTDIGIVLCQKGDLENAEWRHRKALRIRELKGKDDEDCAISLSYLGDVLSRKAEYEEAIEVIKRAQQIRENGLGMDHPVTAATYIDLGNVYYKQGNADLALKEYRRAKVARESMFGPDHQETAVALSCLGNALNLKGDYEAAHNAHMQALDIYAHFLGEGHPMTATGYQNIADTLLLTGEKEKALIQHRKALAIRANILSKDHPDTALSCSRIGDLLAEKDDLVGALVAHKQALAITVGLSGEDTVASAKAHIHVGLVFAAQGEFEEALDEFDQATSVLEKILGEDHEETARAYSLTGSVHSAREEFDDAFELHSQALEAFENILGSQHPKTIAAANKCKMAKKGIAETEF